ncbi:DUF6621 family protein [Hoylesella marshii]|jgi:hypothetical protein|uniref:Uncharacterized protein n=1 Tax=Hoylesella marshii DSM 16973 = JCM 13450 TaxID=862515 RepID=E0NSR2_9BACT|nr:DUF6621 family protein [Hoylesella marshii]EFM01776.1 hypothetical protein HMPREF0658_1264 [Hoylesella marshii DSM 16973 = JCM 13450]
MDKQTKWSNNVIIADADYIDKVAFDLIVNFERMIGRRIPKADMARWIECVALDGGLKEGENDTQVVLIHDKRRHKMENFVPANYDKELNAQAFKSTLGEFTISSYPVEDMVAADDFFVHVLQTVVSQPDVHRVVVIPNAENATLYDNIRQTLHFLDDDKKRITVLAMQPMQGGNFRQEILGYSLMSALGIRADEIK